MIYSNVLLLLKDFKFNEEVKTEIYLIKTIYIILLLLKLF